MGIVLAFAPFIAFAIVERLLGSLSGLLAGALASGALIARDLAHRRVPKIIEIGSALLFGGLALFANLTGMQFSVIAGRLVVDGGLLLLVVFSLMIGVPFTLQYAREQVSPELWFSPAFKRTNVVITTVWAFALAIIAAADALLLLRPDVPRQIDILAIVAALVGAMKFTRWYPERGRAAGAD
jgi:hypothetical protein